MAKKDLRDLAFKALVYSAVALGRAKEALDEVAKQRELKKKEDQLRRNIQSVWDALS